MLTAYKNAKIYTVTNGIIENGTILVEDGKIIGVGTDLAIGGNTEVFDCTGKSITPGFVEAHCHVGVFNEGAGNPGEDGNNWSSPITPELKAIDAIYPDDIGFDDAREHGVTTLCVGPGSANVMGGQMAVVKPKSNIITEMMVTDFVGLKCAFGENPKRVYGTRNVMPMSRMGVAALLRKTLFEVKNYLDKKQAHEADEEKKEPFEKDFAKEVIVQVLKKEKPLRCHAHRMDDIQTAIRIAKEFDVDLVIEHCTEGFKIPKHLIENNVQCIIGPLNGSRSKVELKDMTIDAPKILEENGVDFAITTDAPVERIGSLFDNVRLYIRRGMSDEQGLKSITITPAKILRLEDKIGSIEAGKDADLNIFNGNPFDFRTKLEKVIIDGKTVFGG